MQIATIGIDIAKHVFQVHGASADGEIFLQKRLRRAEVLQFLANATRAWSAWRLAEPPIIGHASCRPWGIA